MRIAIGTDHRGFKLKEAVMDLLASKGHTYEDFGCYDEQSVDYPDIAKKVGEAVASGGFDQGVLICGTGIGMSIAANKVRGIRAALCHSVLCAERARQHNNANVICFGEETGKDLLEKMVTAFLETDFEGGRHQARVDKIMAIEC